jgi:hypothetical protein
MMIWVRWSLLLLFVSLSSSALAFADASTPGKAPGAVASGPAVPTVIEYDQAPDGTFTGTEYRPGMRLFLAADATPVTVAQVRGDKYEVVDEAGRRRTLPVVALTPFAFTVGGTRVTVAFREDFKIEVRGKGTLALDPAGRGYIYNKGGNVSAVLVEGVAPVPLLKVSSRPEACSNYWDSYVSIVDGVPREALTLDGVADPPVSQSSSAKFDARAGTAVVTTSVTEDEDKPAKKTRKRYRWNGSVFVDQGRSKRAASESK